MHRFVRKVLEQRKEGSDKKSPLHKAGISSLINLGLNNALQAKMRRGSKKNFKGIGIKQYAQSSKSK